MAVSLLGDAYDTNSGTHTVTATPAANDLIVIVVVNTGYTGTTKPTDNNSDGLGTYTLLQSNVKNTSGDTLQVYARDALIGSGTSTVFTHAAGTTSGGGLTVLKVTGMSRTGASVKAKSGGTDNQTGVGTPAPSWTGGGSASGSNPLVGVVVQDASTTLTKPATFDTDVHANLTYATPRTSIGVVTDDTGNTDSTVTWGSAISGSSNTWCVSIVELDASVVSLVFADRRVRRNTLLRL